jgi:hypothetical protein
VPLLVFTAFRRYLRALGAVRPIMLAALSANVVNALACFVLVFGTVGFPALGVAGAGVTTTISRVYMLAVVVAYVWRRERHAPTGFAAHQIALTLTSLTFMVPLGLSSAAAARVGYAVGRGDHAGAARAGWSDLALGLAFMTTTALVFVAAPDAILRVFTDDARVRASGVGLLLIAAAALRRRAGRADWRASRHRRYANAARRERGRPLVDRPGGRMPALLRPRGRRARIVGRALRRPGLRRRHPTRGLGAARGGAAVGRQAGDRMTTGILRSVRAW